MDDIPLHQALYGGHAAGGYRFLGQSLDFKEEWLPVAEQLCTGFGERPAGILCPSALFAQPFDKQHVAVVQVADQGQDDAGRPGALAFRLLIVRRDDYVNWIGDPFELSDRFPPDWNARGQLDTLYWARAAVPNRTVQEIEKVLKRSDGPVLLGAVQALIDGGKMVFERSEPDTTMMRSLWLLLPTSTRSAVWPASFAFGGQLDFDAVIVPRAGEGFEKHMTEEQAADYPSGRYELSLQTAVESADQDWLDQLLARRSRAQTWQLGLVLLVVMLVAVLVSNLAQPRQEPEPAPARDKLELPGAAAFHDLNEQEQAELHSALGELAAELKIEPVPATSDELMLAIDEKLGSPLAGRQPATDVREGPPLRRLRVLLWKNGVADYNNGALKSGDLVERLRQELKRRGVLPPAGKDS
ncbi:MAG: hypothetical protein AB7K24_01080 [Gemmataceae bacterium]